MEKNNKKYNSIKITMDRVTDLVAEICKKLLRND